MKSRSESNDLQNALLIPVLNQMICDTQFEVPFWIKLFAIHTLKSPSELNDSQYIYMSSGDGPMWLVQQGVCVKCS